MMPWKTGNKNRRKQGKKVVRVKCTQTERKEKKSCEVRKILAHRNVQRRTAPQRQKQKSERKENKKGERKVLKKRYSIVFFFLSCFFLPKLRPHRRPAIRPNSSEKQKLLAPNMRLHSWVQLGPTRHFRTVVPIPYHKCCRGVLHF